MSENKDNLHEGHRKRLIKKYFENGIECFEDHEILEMFLFSAFKRSNTNPIGHALMNRFGSLENVVNANYDELIDVDGMGETAAALLCFFRDFSRIYDKRVVAGQKMDSAKLLCDYCRALFRGKHTEEVWILFLNQELKLVNEALISTGDIGKVNLDMKRMLEKIIQMKCNVVVLAHNHPMSSELPSKADIATTRRVYNLLNDIGVKLVDHIIVSDSGETSLRGSGHLFDLWHEEDDKINGQI